MVRALVYPHSSNGIISWIPSALFYFRYRIFKWFIFECYNLFCRFGPMETRKFETLMLPWQEIKFLMTNWRFSNRFPNLATNWFPSSRMQKKRKQLTKSNPRRCTSKNFLCICYLEFYNSCSFFDVHFEFFKSLYFFPLFLHTLSDFFLVIEKLVKRPFFGWIMSFLFSYFEESIFFVFN